MWPCRVNISVNWTVCKPSPQVNGRPDHKVYFYDVEMDTVTHFDFFIGRPSSGISQHEESER